MASVHIHHLLSTTHLSCQAHRHITHASHNLNCTCKPHPNPISLVEEYAYPSRHVGRAPWRHDKYPTYTKPIDSIRCPHGIFPHHHWHLRLLSLVLLDHTYKLDIRTVPLSPTVSYLPDQARLFTSSILRWFCSWTLGKTNLTVTSFMRV